MDDKLKSLLVDSWYDSYLGVVILVRNFKWQDQEGHENKVNV